MKLNSDFLVIGSGAAGLSFALKVAPFSSVSIVTKKNPKDTCTTYAQGGVSVVLDPADSFKNHISDTLKAGNGLCKRDVVKTIIHETPSQILQLAEWGVDFTKDSKNNFDLTREGGHSKRRVVHVDDHTGEAIENILLKRCKSHPNIKIYDQHIAIDLITTKKLNHRKKHNS